MNTQRLDLAEEEATKLLVEVFGKAVDRISPPINPIKIAQYLGLTVYSSKLENNVDGIYDKASKSIYVAADSPRNRQIFTVAHELGHYQLHKEKDFDVFYRRDLDELGSPRPLVEQEANAFASSLLMPATLIRRYYEKNKDNRSQSIVSKLAQIFEVSDSAMEWRLHNLKLLLKRQA